MQTKKVAFADTHAFSQFFLDYIQQKETLKPFYNRYPNRDNAAAQIQQKEKSFPQEHRNVLVSALREQYKGLDTTDAVRANIEALASPSTFTVTTGHQLNIFTGPLYFIYKIVTVINACRQLKEQYPQHNFVPVYWMASEDHDYDEIKYFRLYGKKYTWETEQQGAVGRFDIAGIKKLLQEIPGDIELFKTAYTKNKTLGAAVRHYVNTLFAQYGLVILDGDDRSLKALFRPIMQMDILRQEGKPVVDKTSAGLEALGYKTQIYCRDINFFYLDTNLRSRIEKTGDIYTVVDTDIKFTPDELTRIINDEPEKLSPNVILRPLYQEIILPNLAYAGGPAEVIYWLQLKDLFDKVNVPFPMLMPRNFGLAVAPHILKKFEKTDLEWKDLFEDKNYIFNHWVLKHSNRNLTVGAERNAVSDLFEQLKARAEQIDVTLAAFVGAEGKRALNSLEHIERKFLRAEKRTHNDRLRQIEELKEQLFPNGSLQERTDNMLNFYQQDPQFIQKAMNVFDPFDFQFYIMFV